MRVRWSKNAVSLILALMMLISVMIVGVIHTASAEAELTATGDTITEVWFTRPKSWNNTPNVYYWGGLRPATWPGTAMTYKGDNNFGESIFYATIPGDSDHIIFNNGSYQTAEIPITGPTVVAYFVTGNDTSDAAAVESWGEIPAPEVRYMLTVGYTTVDVSSGYASMYLTPGSQIYNVNANGINVKRGGVSIFTPGTYDVVRNLDNTCTFTLHTDPTAEPTDPTEEPTDPTEEPTDEPSVTYTVGDTDGSGKVTITDATAIQRILVGIAYSDDAMMRLRGKVTAAEGDLTIMDATAIQRYLAGFRNTYGIGAVKTTAA